MQLNRRRFIGAALAASVAACTTRSVVPPQAAAPAPLPVPVPEPLPAVVAQIERPPLLAAAMAALDRHGIAARDRVALVDFSLASREPRMHLVNVESGQIERSWLVSHGSGSDPKATGLLERFSNVPGSNASSEGAFLTADRYIGQHGQSQRLIGLDPTNDMAFNRAIVIHGAEYVSPRLIKSQGRIGRSQGCFALQEDEVRQAMDMLGQGRLIYAGKFA